MGGLKCGILKMCALTVPSRHEYHGYKLAKEIRGYFPQVNGSTVYGILGRLQGEGSVGVFCEADPKGRRGNRTKSLSRGEAGILRR